ncbi:MAG TPA: hypothetical protein VIA06_24855 [Candidatus Dormibacteraeota bacterium]|jgi:hypothetical protein|nr:hypothetical protein [Candidatus Dormibacteraeota bacterium]
MGKRETLEVLFTDREHARRAIQALTGAGFRQEDLGSLGPSDAPVLRSAFAGGVLGSLVGATIGGVLATVMALGTGLGLSEGLVLAGVATGAVAGLAAGVLLRREIADEDRYLAREVDAGRTLLKVWVSADCELEVMAMLRGNGAIEAGPSAGRRVTRPRIVDGPDVPGSRAA